MRTNKPLSEIIDEIIMNALAKQMAKAYVEPELNEPETVDLDELLLAQHRTKRWLEDESS